VDAALFFKVGEFAPGIPELRKRALPSVREPEDWDFVEQHHDADKAKFHSDFRISDGDTAFSWMVRKGIPPPGKSHLAVRQPDHAPSYMPFEGEIPSGYGKGSVRVNRDGPIRVTGMTRDKVNLALLDKRNPQEVTMVRTPKYGPDHWLMINTTPTVKSRPGASMGKPTFRKDSIESIGKYLGNRYVLSSKIDGGQVEVHLGKRTEVFSHDPSTSGEHINYTYLLGADRVKPPKEFRRSKVQAEVFGVRNGKVIPQQELAPIMNASTGKSLKDLEEKGIQLFVAPFKVVEHKGQTTSALKYGEQINLLKSLVGQMPKNWVIPDLAFTDAEKQKMVSKIRKGKHPLTREGAIAWPLHETAATPTKLPIRPHSQVYIVEIYPMKSKGKDLPLAGGFSYSLKPGGPAVGRVGTGFDMQIRKELWEERARLTGKAAIVSSLREFKSGAKRAPSFISLHL
jgi:hypothetical protein